MNVLALQGMLVGDGAVSHGLLLKTGVIGDTPGCVLVSIESLYGVQLDWVDMSSLLVETETDSLETIASSSECELSVANATVEIEIEDSPSVTVEVVQCLNST